MFTLLEIKNVGHAFIQDSKSVHAQQSTHTLSKVIYLRVTAGILSQK